MADKNDKPETKRPSKSQRTHVRRMKQAERKEALVNLNSSTASWVQPLQTPKKKEA